MLNSLRARNVSCEEEAKFTQERILSAEKNLAELCHVFAQYSRKAARVRDKGDAVAQAVAAFGESEDINKSLSCGLTDFASSFAAVNDYGDLRVQYIDDKVVGQFSQYDGICKQAKEEVKQIFGARDRELSRKKQLDRIRERNPRNRQQIIQAETELVKATAEVSRTIHNLEEKVTAFERQKLHDLKGILLDFISAEMGYHAKALEHLTKAYQAINAIDEEADLQAFHEIRESKEVEFKKALQIPDVELQAAKPKRSPFRTSQSLGSINTILSSNKRSSPGIPTPAQRKPKSAEALDSLKNDLSETSETISDQENTSENTEQSREEQSPFARRKYLK